MEFNDIFYSYSSEDVLLIQPHVLKHVQVKDMDPVQLNYWEKTDKVGSLIGDLPIEPNWGLLYIASALKQKEYKVSYIDFHLFDYVKHLKTDEFISDEDIESILSKKKCSVIAISSMTRSADRALKIARICKKVNPSCKILLGGIHFSFTAKETLEQNDFVDVVMSGEGEKTFVELMEHIDDIEYWKNIEGLSFRIDNEIFSNEKLGYNEDIDKILWPDYSLWPSDVPLIPRVYLARGCIGNCSYCVVNQLFSCKVRYRNLEDVINEIIMLKQKYNVTEFLVGDLCFPMDKNKTLDFCNALIENKLDLKWWCQSKPNLIDDDVLHAMKRAGCAQIAIGIESADAEVLIRSNSNKYINKKDYRTIFDICKMIKKYEILIQGYFILGLPGDTFDSCISTINLMDRLTGEDLVDVTHISVLVPYPGTSTMENHEDFGVEIVDRDYSNYLMNCDLMNAGVPVYNLEKLDRYQIYSFWQLALSTVARNYSKRENKKIIMFNDLNCFAEKLEIKEEMKIN